MARSVIYVTTPTSGSQSLWRILNSLVPVGTECFEASAEGSPNLPTAANFKEHGQLVMVRGVYTLDPPVFDPRLRYIVNFRDPRDMFCNQYHWLWQHPIIGIDDPEEFERARAARAARASEGIDASVLRHSEPTDFKFVFELAEAAANGAPDILFVSYAQLCCDYVSMIGRVVNFLGAEVTPQARAVIHNESPAGLQDNNLWIGNEWTGTDIQPGRYKTELRPETIAELDRRFGPTLDRLAALETPNLRHLYSHG